MCKFNEEMRTKLESALKLIEKMKEIVIEADSVTEIWDSGFDNARIKRYNIASLRGRFDRKIKTLPSRMSYKPGRCGQIKDMHASEDDITWITILSMLMGNNQANKVVLNSEMVLRFDCTTLEIK